MSDTVTSERPATVTEAFARDSAGAGSQPAPSEPTVQTSAEPAAAITPPESNPGTESPTVETSPGEPPKERWDAILKNAREKTRAEVLKEWEPYQWARQVPRESVEQAVQLARQVQTDPVGFFRQLYAELDSHPTHAAQLRSEAARLLGSGRKQADLSPDVEIMGPDGTVAGRTFSAERVQALMQQAVHEALSKEIGPIKTDFERRQATEREAAQQRQLDQQLTQIEQRITSIVGKDNLPAVAEALSNPEFAHLDPIDVAIHVLQQRQKTAQTQADVKALETLQRKAAASTPNPAAAAVPATKRPKSLTDPSLKWA